MTDSLLLPICLDRIVNANGVPYGGAKVYVYDAGTTDEKNVYTNATLMTGADNPIEADAGGYIPARYIGTGSYKLVITTADDVTIKTEDNLPGALNTAPFEASTAKPVTPTIATAVSRIISVSELGSVVYADPTGGDIVITLPSPGDAGDGKRLTVSHEGTTGVVTIEEADTVATLVSAGQAVTVLSNAVSWSIKGTTEPNGIARLSPPQGYLTLVSGTPVISSDQASKTSVYYTPDQGSAIPIFNGMRFIPYEFSELTLALVTQHLASNIYDVFVFLDPADGETVVIGTGPSWADGAVAGSVTAGSCARGTGAGSTALTRTRGLYVNTNAMTARNGSATYSVAAARATYVGSIFIDGSAGQVTCHAALGQTRKWGVWNAYNRRPIALQLSDPTSSWAYSGNTFQQSNASASNTVAVFCGLADEYVDIVFVQAVDFTSNATAEAHLGIGINSTTGASGKIGRAKPSAVAAPSDFDVTARYLMPPALGHNNINSIERGSSAAQTSWYGAAYMNLTARWRG